jgi:hypothetical protein
LGGLRSTPIDGNTTHQYVNVAAGQCKAGHCKPFALLATSVMPASTTLAATAPTSKAIEISTEGFN